VEGRYATIFLEIAYCIKQNLSKIAYYIKQMCIFAAKLNRNSHGTIASAAFETIIPHGHATPTQLDG
jgi:hypothetical protein